MFNVIVTAPHSLCVDDIEERHCDRVAYFAASNLVSMFSNIYSMSFFPSNTLRSDIDLNRFPSRETSYRQSILSNLLNSQNADLVLDVHSFPRGGFSGTGEEDSEITILDETPGTWYGKLLYEILSQKGIDVSYLLGDRNDIVTLAREYGIPAILIEYSELLNSERIKEINLAIGYYIELIRRKTY